MLITLSLIVAFYYKVGLPDVVDIVFAVYALFIASLFADNLNSMMILFTALPHMLYAQNTFTPFLVGLAGLLQIRRIGLKKKNIPSADIFGDNWNQHDCDITFL